MAWPKKQVRTAAQVAVQFKPGQSGNLNGRPKGTGAASLMSYREATAMARENVPLVIARLCEIVANKRSKHRDVINAGIVLLERGLGKAPMLVKLEADENVMKPAGTQSVTPNDITRAAEIARILIEAGALESVIDEDGQRKLKLVEPEVVEPEKPEKDKLN